MKRELQFKLNRVNPKLIIGIPHCHPRSQGTHNLQFCETPNTFKYSRIRDYQDHRKPFLGYDSLYRYTVMFFLSRIGSYKQEHPVRWIHGGEWCDGGGDVGDVWEADNTVTKRIIQSLMLWSDWLIVLGEWFERYCKKDKIDEQSQNI